MATYQTLQFSSFTDLIVPFRTFNGVNQYSTGTQTITGYTLELTKFTFTPILSALENTNIGVSLDKLIWDFGDGTTDTGFSVTKHYKYPGEYVVTTIFTDQNGVTHRNRAQQVIYVYNYVPDAIQWYTPTIADETGGKPEQALCGVPSDDLTIYRYNSWQSWPMVSGDGGYYINLYAQGSRSRPLTPDMYWKSADAHLSPSWRFVKNKQSKVPIDRVQTDVNQHVYVKLVDGELIHTTSDDATSEFAGTSGMVTVNYIDDTSNRITSARETKEQKNSSSATFKNENLTDAEFNMSPGMGSENKDIILFASFDTSKFPVTNSDDSLSTFETLKKDYFQIYETQKVGLPIIIKFNTPAKLTLTSNGIESFPINVNKYINSPFSVTTRVAGASGNVLCTSDVVALSSRWEAPSIAFSGGDLTTDVVTAQGFVSMYLSGVNSRFNKVVAGLSPEEDFMFWDVGEVVPELGEDGVTTAANTVITLLLTERVSDQAESWDGRDIFDKKYVFTGRAVSLLTTQLDSRSYEILNETNPVNLKTVARDWLHSSGRKYYGCVAKSSRYNTRAITKNSLLQHPEMDIDNTQLNSDLYGTLLSQVNLNVDWPSVSGSNRFRIFAETKLDPPLYFNYDVKYYYLTNSTNDTFHQIKPVYYRQYSYGDDGSTQTYTPPITTVTPGNSGLYGFATDPDGNVIMVDGDTDKIIRYYGNRKLRHETPVHALLPDVSANHFPGDPDKYGYSPSSVSLDKKLDYWVTLYDTVSTIKLDGETNQVIAVAVPPVVDYLAAPRQTNPINMWSASAQFQAVETSELLDYRYGPMATGVENNWSDNDDMWQNIDTNWTNLTGGATRGGDVPGEYGESLINPTTVETCKNNDIVVTYSNPLCSFVARYDTNGNFMYKFDIPGEDQYFPGDVCVDVSDHTWVVAEETGLNPDGSVNMNPPKSRIYSLNEELQQRLVIESVKGAEYQDMLSPSPAKHEIIDINMLVSTEWDYDINDYVAQGLIVEEFGDSTLNPPLTLYEGNTYNFNNLMYNNGKHPLFLREILETEQVSAVSGTWDQLTPTGNIYTENVSGEGTETLSIYVSSTTPSAMLLVDDNFPDADRLVIKTIKKPKIDSRSPDSFDMINNASHVIPDNNNNIWFSWGSRYCSRYNTTMGVVDTTVAVGSAYHDPRFHPLSAETHDRRDNADRRSSIEGLAFDTANNLLVINNADKRLYAINSETPLVSAYINITNNQIPYGEYSWVESVSGRSRATENDFLIPSSYLTEEQIRVFLNNVSSGEPLTSEQRQLALDNYLKMAGGELGNVVFRESHGAPGVHDVGFEQDIRAGGDWTGWRWINKYDDRLVASDASTGLVSVSGCSDEFVLLPKTGTHDISKINENVDFAETLRGYIKQSTLIEKENFYNNFLNSIFGSKGDDPGAIGKRVYERISNYVSNHSDIDTNTIAALKNMAKMTGFKLKEFGTELPAEMQRVVDLLSIKFTKLRGVRTDYQDDFEKYGNHVQQSIGVNLGSELMFIYDYDPEKVYNTGDYVRYLNEYYESIEVVPAGVSPPEDLKTNTYWRHWPGGLIKPRHMDDVVKTMNHMFRVHKSTVNHLKQVEQSDGPSAVELEKQRMIDDNYNDQVTLIKLIERLFVQMSDKYVLKNDLTEDYTVVTTMTKNWDEQRDYYVTLDGDRYHVSNSFVGPDVIERNKHRRFNEFLSDIELDNGYMTIDQNNVITLMGASDDRNPTIVLFRDRTYRLHLDCFGHPMEITLSPGVSGERASFVSQHELEYGTLVFNTNTDPTWGPVPDVLYYQSTVDPRVSGTILVRSVSSVDHYSNEYQSVTAFNIDISYGERRQLESIGWGLDTPDNQSAWQYYTLYEFKQNANPDQKYVSNTIDWDDTTHNTIDYTRTLSGDYYDQWTKDSGDMDIIIEKTLRQGLDLFDGLDNMQTNFTSK